MSDCAYEQDGQYAMRALESECRGLREDLDNLLAATEQQRLDTAELKRALGMLRSRVNWNEMVAS